MVSPAIALLRAVCLQLSEEPNHQHLWLCDKTIHRRIRSLHPTLNANPTAINRALIGVCGSHHKLNICGLFHCMFKTICPYSQKRRPVHFYYRYVGVEPSIPRRASDVEDVIAKSFRLVEARENSTRDSSNKNNNDETEAGKSKINQTGLDMSNLERANQGGGHKRQRDDRELGDHCGSGEQPG